MKMKFLLLLVTVISMCGNFMSCTSEDGQPKTPHASNASYAAVNSRYLEAKEKVRIGSTNIYNRIVPANSTLGLTQVSGAELLQYLTSLPTDRLDSLANIYCTEKITDANDRLFEESCDKFETLTSPEDLDVLFTFASEYIALGGHSINYLFEQIQDKHEITQECMIHLAASIDEYMPTETTRSIYNQFCFEQMLRSIGDDLVQDAIVEPVFDYLDTVPYIDVLSILVQAGMDLNQAIKLAQDYDRCISRIVS